MIEIRMGMWPDLPVTRFGAIGERFDMQKMGAAFPFWLAIEKEDRNPGFLRCGILRHDVKGRAWQKVSQKSAIF